MQLQPMRLAIAYRAMEVRASLCEACTYNDNRMSVYYEHLCMLLAVISAGHARARGQHVVREHEFAVACLDECACVCR